MTVPADTLEHVGGALVQHGPSSNRIYLMKIGSADPAALADALDALARERGYGKVFAKLPANAAAPFLARGYRVEARVPGLFGGRTEGLFLGRYPDPARADAPDAEEIAKVLAIAQAKAGAGVTRALPEGASVRACGPDDTDAMAALYREVFASYPFPIHNPAYLRETMQTHVTYFGVEREGRLVALASAERDDANGHVEMTDFATPPAERGQGLAVHLLSTMEKAMHGRGVPTAYTIARAVSAGMNVTFARLGYAFGGTLVNNTQISGRIESMNVWSKQLGG